MLTVEEALGRVVERATPLPPRRLSIEDARGLVLSQEIRSDLDLPPFDKALVDGYAIRASAFLGGQRTFRVVEEVPAGRNPTAAIGPEDATLVMTGAPLPDGADTVVMHEKTERMGGVVRILDADVGPGRNRLTRGREMRAGDVVLRPGTPVTPAVVGLLASVGRTLVEVIPRPAVAVLPTGDELVGHDRSPGPGQIRNSNGPMLEAFARSSGADARVLPVAPDDADRLRESLALGLQDDVLLVSGGVSAGNRDLVPAALEALGVEPVFHKVRLKPGKPLWFGIGPRRGTRPGTLVFGLPGNPVSGVVGFILFVRPALDRLSGRADTVGRAIRARLSVPFRHSGDRPTYHPCRLRALADGVEATPLDWAGSADLRTVASADGFAIFEAGDRAYVAGEIVGVLPLG